MEIEEELLEPLKMYNYELKYKHEDNIKAFFDGLTQESGVDIEANRATCSEYYQHMASIANIKRKLGNKRGLRGFLIFCTIFSFIVGTILILLSLINLFNVYTPVAISIAIALIAGGIVCIVLNSTSIARSLSSMEEILNGYQKKANEAKKTAEEQMACLNRIYDWNIPSSLMDKTISLIKMDKNFTTDRLLHMVKNYGFKPNDDDCCSTLFVQSGTIIGNPFMVERDYIESMLPHTYTGTLVITWVTYSRDSKGRSYPVTHTQTLVATVIEPAPNYYTDTCLIYVNEAAPRLNFSRTKSNANNMSEKQIEKLEAEYDRKFAKGNKYKFTPLGNSKFEGLFHAFDRDNDVEFRLLFTPLAQKNMINLITSKTPYGDDFRFVKRKCVNLIHSEHAQSMDFDGNPASFYNFDYDKAKENFFRYNINYFTGIYYDLAVLLSIPLYQQCRDYDIHDLRSESYHTTYEAETLANFFSPELFEPEENDTHLILKAKFEAKLGKGIDLFTITAHGFKQIPQMKLVPKLGGDGNTHMVPVHYYIYEEVSKDTPLVVMDLDITKVQAIDNKERIEQLLSPYCVNNDIIIQRGLCSFILKDGIKSFDGRDLYKLFSQKED